MHVIGSLDQGGAEKILVSLLEHGDADRHRPSVVCIAPVRAGPVWNAIQRLGVAVTVLGASDLASLPRVLFKLRRLARIERPDVIQGWMYHSNVLVSLAASGRHDPPVFWNIRHTVRDVWRDEKLVTAASIRVGARLSRRVHRIIYCANASRAAHELRGYDPSRVSVIHNGVDVEAYRPLPEERARIRAELGIPPDAELIGRIARWHPMKDYATFITAASRILAERPHARFLLAGRGVTWSNVHLARSLRQAGIQDRAVLLGPRTDVARLLPALDVACSSSSFGEGFPNIVLEAMACGVPSVVTDVGDSRFLVGSGDHVAPPMAPGALARACLAILGMEPSRRAALGLSGRRRVVAHFDLRRMLRQYETVYARARLPVGSTTVREKVLF